MDQINYNKLVIKKHNLFRDRAASHEGFVFNSLLFVTI